MKNFILGILAVASIASFSSFANDEAPTNRRSLNFPAICASPVPFATVFCSAKYACEQELEMLVKKPIKSIKITSFEGHKLGSGYDDNFAIFTKEFYCYFDIEE